MYKRKQQQQQQKTFFAMSKVETHCLKTAFQNWTNIQEARGQSTTKDNQLQSLELLL